ncbi:type II secretion system major pseudopilin GspG [Chlamydiota bacterium]
MKRYNGFTLLEIMIVVIIIAIISSMVFPRVLARKNYAKRWQAILKIREIQSGLEQFYSDYGYFPSEEEGLEVLLLLDTDRTGLLSRQAGYLRDKKDLIDPWGNKIIYLNPGMHEEIISIISLGKDGQWGGESWNRDIPTWSIDEQL